MLKKLYTVAGNTSPNIVIPLWRDGLPATGLAGSTINLVIVSPTGTITNTGHQTCTLTDPTNSIITYTIQTGDIAAAGTYLCKVQVNYASGKYEEWYEEFNLLARS